MALIWQDNFEGSGPNVGTGTRALLNSTDPANGQAGTIGNYSIRTNLTDAFNIGMTATFTGFEGSFLWRVEHVDDISAGTDLSVIEFAGIDISGSTGLNFSGLYGGRDTGTWDGDEEFAVSYSIDGGGFTTALRFLNDGVSRFLVQDVNLDGVLTAADAGGITLTQALQDISFAVVGTGSILTVRILTDVGSSEEIAFDNFRVNDDGAPVVTGTNASEVLTGTAIAETLLGLGGNDKLDGGLGGDVLDGGSGIDTAKYTNAAAGVVVDLVNGGTGGEANGDSYISIERVGGSAFADTITGDDNANVLLGGGGMDTLNGAGGNDYLRGGADGDTLNGGEGRDLLDGGAGGDILNGGNGIDTADYRKASTGVTVDLDTPVNSTGDAAGDTYSSIERFILSENNDFFIGNQAVAADDFVRGGDGSDTLTGNAGNDRLYGDDGSDILSGGDGIDRLFGGAGNDNLTGGADRDAFFFGAGGGTDTITDWTNGEDRIIFFASSGVTDFSDLTVLQSNDDVLVLYGGSNFLFLSDTLLSDVGAGDFGFI